MEGLEGCAVVGVKVVGFGAAGDVAHLVAGAGCEPLDEVVDEVGVGLLEVTVAFCEDGEVGEGAVSVEFDPGAVVETVSGKKAVRRGRGTYFQFTC